MTGERLVTFVTSRSISGSFGSFLTVSSLPLMLRVKELAKIKTG